MSQIGNNIKKLRKVKGISQQAFADMFNLTRGNISSYEELRAEPKIEVILSIAKYFSIPVSELLEKQLTVNEILNFEDHFDGDATSINTKNLTAIPFLNQDYLKKNSEITNLQDLPQIYFPLFNKHQLLAVENNSSIANPTEFPFGEHDILFFEQVDIDILHTLNQQFGFYAKGEEMFFGQYKILDKKIKLTLNDWMKVYFSEADKGCFWKLYAKFQKV